MSEPKADLDGIAWEHPESGMWVGKIKKADGVDYQVVLHYRQFDEVWEVMCMISGALVHRSEHESRLDAAEEALIVVMRAQTIRDRNAP